MPLPLLLRTVALALAAPFLLPAPSHAQEADPRLQSNGPGWRLEHARITDPKLPRVLLIGDSILNGYMTGTIRALRGKANVDAWVNPYHQANAGLPAMVADVMAQGPYDIIHFNMGLHGLKPGQFKEGEYEPSTRRLVEGLRKGSPNAKLIWASITPAMTGTKPNLLNPELNPIVLEHNRMAANVMKEMGVPINDFYSLLVDHLDLSAGDFFHWTYPASDILSRALVKSLAPLLGMNDADIAAAYARIDEPEWTRADFRVDISGDAQTRVDPQVLPGSLAGVLPSWAKDPGSLLLYTGPITMEWQKLTFTFVPRTTGKVTLALRGDFKFEKKAWTAFDNLAVTGARLDNGDFEEIGPDGMPTGWKGQKAIVDVGAAQSGTRSIRVCRPDEFLSQELAVEEGKPVTVSFYVKVGNPPLLN